MAGFVVERDVSDHFRFSPIQTDLAQELCRDYDMPLDVSTAILIDEQGAHSHSTAILRLGLHLGWGYAVVSRMAILLVPRIVRDFGYSLFARNRGRIWKAFKRMTGLSDTRMEPYRDHVVGLVEPLDPGWGFDLIISPTMTPKS